MTNTPAISARGLTKSYGQIRALQGVNLEVLRGEIFGFLGPNGSGKTTTIRCLLDLIRPDGGTLRVLGFDPQRDSVAVRSRTGYLPGELRVDDSFTVEGALKFFGALRGHTLDWAYVRELAERFSLDLKLSVKNLSKGNKQKVGVIQAMMPRPELLMLDEPTSGLDPLMQREVLNVIRAARDNGATIFFSSHVLSEVEAIADRVGIIRQGEVVEIAETQALIKRAMRRVNVRFKQPSDLAAITALPGVRLISHDDSHCQLQVEGDIDQLIKALALYPVADLEIERTSLEEIFLAYYDEVRP